MSYPKEGLEELRINSKLQKRKHKSRRPCNCIFYVQRTEHRIPSFLLDDTSIKIIIKF